MKHSANCTELTKRFEGCRLNAYPDPGTGGAPWTIGWGHTFGVRAGMVIYQDQADKWLEEDLDNAAGIVDLWVRLVNQNQFDALTDFVYNVGPGMPGHRDGFVWLKSGVHSTMLRLLINGETLLAGEEFPKWNLPPLPGIVPRRKAEMDLFFRAI